MRKSTRKTIVHSIIWGLLAPAVWIFIIYVISFYYYFQGIEFPDFQSEAMSAAFILGPMVPMWFAVVILWLVRFAKGKDSKDS